MTSCIGECECRAVIDACSISSTGWVVIAWWCGHAADSVGEEEVRGGLVVHPPPLAFTPQGQA